MGISGGFVSGHRFSGAISYSKSKAPLAAGRRNRTSLAVAVLTLLFSIYALAESAADIYKTKCSACHSSNGVGDTMLGKNLKLRSLTSDEVQKQSDNELAIIISKGKGRMPAYDRKLSKEQIGDVVKYIRALKK